MPTDVRDLVPGRHLLPHERWNAQWFFRRRSSPTMASTRFNQKYGPEGIVLMGAALATSLPGVLLAWAGIALIVVSRDRNPLGSIASWMLAFSLLLIVLSSIRLQQAKDAGERFNARQKREPGDAPGQDIV